MSEEITQAVGAPLERHVRPLVEKLRERRQAVAWSRGQDTDYPTKWEPDALCQQAADALDTLYQVHADFRRECDDADAILRVLGFDPVNCRTDGGSLKLVMLLGAIEHRDVMTRRAARKAERERCAALCDGLAKVMTPDRRGTAEELARAIREDQP